MTEADWLQGSNSHEMLPPCRKVIRYHLQKGRLFAVACCNRILNLLTDNRSRSAIKITEQFAAGRASDEELRAAAKAAEAAHADAFRAKGKIGASGEWAAQFAASSDAWFAATRASNFAYVAAGDPVLEPGPEKEAQSKLLRCIFGPLPFRSVTLDSMTLTQHTQHLAELIYEDQTFDRLPILADLLEEAGCQQDEVLNHLRSGGEHVRGCWALDLVLGKS